MAELLIVRSHGRGFTKALRHFCPPLRIPDIKPFHLFWQNVSICECEKGKINQNQLTDLYLTNQPVHNLEVHKAIEYKLQKGHSKFLPHENYGNWELRGSCRENLHYLWKWAVRIVNEMKITGPIIS